MKDPTDKQWANDPGFLGWRAFIEKYYPGADVTDATTSMAIPPRRPWCRR